MQRASIIILFILFICINNIYSLTLKSLERSDKIVLTGNIVLKDIYGPPNYGDNPESDRIETYYFLILDTPITIKFENTDKSISGLQLVFPPDFKKPEYSPETTYLVYGEPFIAHTGHHHSDVLISVEEIIPVNQSIKPLPINLYPGDEVRVKGSLVVRSGWPPNVIMIINNCILGIGSEEFPADYMPLSLIEIIVENNLNVQGLFKFTCLGKISQPYYDEKLLIFSITGYESIETDPDS